LTTECITDGRVGKLAAREIAAIVVIARLLHSLEHLQLCYVMTGAMSLLEKPQV
jgi:hypothetical protein